jgi:hypothetical protein
MRHFTGATNDLALRHVGVSRRIGRGAVVWFMEGVMACPSIKEMIRAKRDGKSDDYAVKAYCYSKSVIPVRVHSDGRLIPVHWQDCWQFLRAFDAFDSGATDEEIATAFVSKPDWDIEYPVAFKAMEKGEGPSFDDLVAMLSLDEQVDASRFFGVKRIAQAIIASAQ